MQSGISTLKKMVNRDPIYEISACNKEKNQRSVERQITDGQLCNVLT
ncbi:hypothetical protein T4D_5293 [Trichinella pseudospiralis]|uniref:Uncharacterized protein n=1 Tax=Trichinella pseudospiralis TaxID=6337 RepID=A0A0V1DSL0_TRIPS|nr:hypothetical protein T4D_5293 [Trichinella pseudospiralis]